MTDTTQASPLAHRPELSPFVLNALVAAYLLAICNSTFWVHLFRIFEGRSVVALVFAGAVWALMLLVVSVLALRRAQKPVLVALLITAGVTSYYVDVLGVMVDREMIQNAVTTTFANALNGFAVRATATQARALAARPDVALVLPDELRHPAVADAKDWPISISVTRGNGDQLYDFLGLTGRPESWRSGMNGSGVTIGVMATGRL